MRGPHAPSRTARTARPRSPRRSCDRGSRRARALGRAGCAPRPKRARQPWCGPVANVRRALRSALVTTSIAAPGPSLGSSPARFTSRRARRGLFECLLRGVESPGRTRRDHSPSHVGAPGQPPSPRLAEALDVALYSSQPSERGRAQGLPGTIAVPQLAAEVGRLGVGSLVRRAGLQRARAGRPRRAAASPARCSPIRRAFSAAPASASFAWRSRAASASFTRRPSSSSAEFAAARSLARASRSPPSLPRRRAASRSHPRSPL